MNFWEHMNFTGTELHIDAGRWITEFHETLQRVLELCLGETWHVTKIAEQSTVRYDATLTTRTLPNPKYIQTQVVATFDVEARENGALDRIVEGLKLSIPRKTLHFTAELMDNGHLRITESTLNIPTRA